MASLGTVTNSYMDSHGLHETELVQETPIAISIAVKKNLLFIPDLSASLNPSSW